MVRCFFITSPDTPPETSPSTPNTHHPTPNTQHPSPSNHQHPSPNTHHPVTINTHHPSPNTQMVRCLVRCLMGCLPNTSPSKLRSSKGLPGVLVRCSASVLERFRKWGGGPAQGSSHLRIEKKGHYALPAGRNDIFLNILSESFGDLLIIDYLCRTENTCRNRTCKRWKR